MSVKPEIQTLLPDDFHDSLALIPKSSSVTLLTRHSIREQAENYNAHHSLPLTSEGRDLAYYWGGLQPFKEIQLFSSPVGRCIETARHMHKGLLGHDQIDPVVLPTLTEPGCFIPNKEVMHKVGSVFVQEGPFVFMNQILSGHFNEHICLKSSVTTLIEQFKNTHNQSSHSLNLHVSHDTVLAAFVYTLLGKSTILEHDWPRMMEGVYLWFDETSDNNDELFLVWRGERYTINLLDLFETET